MRDLVSKVILNIGAKGVSVCMVLAMHVMFALWLNSGDYGQFVLLQVIAMGLAIYGQSGMQNALIKLISERTDMVGAFQIWSACIRIIIPRLLFAIILFCAIALLLLYMGKVQSVAAICFFIVYLIAQTFMFLLLGWYCSVDKAYVSSLLEQGSFSGVAVALCFLWGAAGNDLNLLTVAGIYSLSTLAVMSFSMFFAVKEVIVHRAEELKVAKADVLRLANKFLIMQLAFYLTSWAAIPIVGLFLQPESVAEINVAQRVAQVIVFFLMSFNGVVGPRFAKLYAQNKLSDFQYLAKFSANLLAVVTVPLIIVLIVYGPLLLGFFGPQYVSAYPLLLIIMAGQIVNVMTGSVGYILNMTNNEKVMHNIVLVGCVLNLLFTVFGVLFFGVKGAAVGLSLGVVINNSLAAYFVYKRLGFVTVPGLQWIVKA
ncbi:polysaccharide biosynthesis C-terminal domain-containing protein [Reinekea marinisedimentorum]|uniref:O-antigen/teichoic acid export membrane protein n=1 Tax=Reinekea marinisedimentorum TaxID=230495 RepID=A0A4R3I716_9GAMM|nr:oligosaccharide flippase family protein [Reinekea marinisedimentorum]TCS41926.1 O-antigen/teichoic acid export membrane protein [Reinekea marinisedimentorum]